MVDVVETKSDIRLHQMFFDHVFPSHPLLKSLAEREVRATGTVTQNIVGRANQLLTVTSTLEDAARGTSNLVHVPE